MSATIDNRVVEMQFDNKQFEKNVDTSLHTLDRLKAALTFDKESKNLNELSTAGKKFNLDGIGASVDELANRFSALGVIGITALQRIANKAMDTGEKLIKSLTIDQVSSGFSKYEEKTNAVQTIMLSTGKSIEEVNQVLDKLNDYTDETSYSFSQMVGTIGKFTGAGVELSVAEDAMEGIANWAASAGVSAKQAGPAFYNLAQAVSTGSIKMQDWKSIELLNMSTKEFKQAAIESGLAIGTLVKSGEEYKTVAKGNTVTTNAFNSTLSDGWLTTEVLIDTLHKFADQSTDFGLKMYHSAQEAKTWTDAIEAVKEAEGSGWSKSFELVFGNYEEARKLWTALANTLIEFVDAGASARNQMLSVWKEFGGRTGLIVSVTYAFEGLLRILGAVKAAWTSVFPPITGQILYDITRKVRDFVKACQPTERVVLALYRAFKGFFSVIKLGLDIIKAFVNAFNPVLKPVGDLVLRFVDLIGYFGAFLTYISNYIRESGILNTVFSKLFENVSRFGLGIIDIAKKIADFVKRILDLEAVKNIGTYLTNAFRSFGTIASPILAKVISLFEKLITKVKTFKRVDISPYVTKLGTGFRILFGVLTKVKDTIVEFFRSLNISLPTLSDVGTSILGLGEKFVGLKDKAKDLLSDKNGGIFAIANTKTLLAPLKLFGSGIALVGSKFKELIGKTTTSAIGAKDNPYFESLKTNLDTAKNKLKEFIEYFVTNIQKVNVGKLLLFGLSVGLIKVVFSLDKLIGAMTTLTTTASTTLSTLVGAFTGVPKSITKFFDTLSQRIAKPQTTITQIAVSIAILAASMYALSRVPSEDLIKAGIAIAGLGVALVALSFALGKINKGDGGGWKTVIALGGMMIAFAGAVLILSKALEKLDGKTLGGTLDALKILGLLGAGLAAFTILLAKFAPTFSSGSLFLIAFSFSLNKLVDAVIRLSENSARVSEDALTPLMEIVLMLSGLALAASKMKFGSGTGIFMLVGAILLLETALKKIQDSDLSFDLIKQNVEKYIIVVGAIAALLGLVGLFSAGPLGKNAVKGAVGVLAAVGAMYLMFQLLKKVAETAIEIDLNILKTMGLLVGGVSVLMVSTAAAGKNAIKGALAVVILTGALFAQLKFIEMLSKFDSDTLHDGINSILVLEVALGALIAVSELTEKAKLGPIIGLTIAIGVIAAAIGLLTSLNDPDGVQAAGAAVGLGLIGFAVALVAVSEATQKINVLPLVGAIAALVAVVAGIAILANMDWQSLAAAAAGIAIVLIALAGAAKLANGAIAGAAALDLAALAMIGVALAIAIFTAAVDSFVTTLLRLSGVTSEETTNITNFIVAMGGAIGEGLANAILSFGGTFIAALAEAIGPLWETLTGYIDTFIEHGREFVGGIVSGIGERLGDVVSKAGEIVDAALEGLGDLATSAFNAAKDFISGFVSGLEDAPLIGGVVKAAKSIGSKAVEGLRSKDGIDSHSDSKETIAAAHDYVMGFVHTVTGYAGSAKDACMNFGNKAVQGLKESAIGDEGIISSIFAGAHDTAFGGLMAALGLDGSFASGINETSDAVNNLAGSVGDYSAAANGRGGASSSAKAAGKESKKLFNVLKDGQKVIQKFAQNFGSAYSELGKTHPLELGQEAVQKFAEKIYEASLKGKDAAEIAALTTEDRLAGMREAWDKYNEDVKSTIDGQTDVWGKLTQKATVATKDWSRNLKSQRVQLNEWAEDLKKLARRGVSEGFIQELVNMGPEMDYQVKQLLASPKSQLNTLLEEFSKYPETTEDVMSTVVAVVAATSTGIIDETNVLSEKVNANFQQMKDEITSAFNEGKITAEEFEQKLKEVEQKQKDYADATSVAMEQAKLSYVELRDAVKDAVESQLDLFEKFDDSSDLTGDELLDNMESQVHGVQNWSNNLSELLEKGLDEGLYKKLAEMGPKSYKYVQAFMEMTSSELDRANSYFQQSLTIGQDIGEGLANDFAVAGLMASEGFKNGMDPTASVAQARTMAQNVVNAFRQELDIHSPSGVTQGIGKYTAEGLKVGIENNTFQPVGSAIKMANEILTRLKASMPESDYINIGRYVAEGLAKGIRDNASTAINAAVKMASDAYRSACAEVGVESPSKAFAEMGRFCDIGLALGFKDKAGEVEEASETVASRAYNSMRAIVDHIADIINGEVQIDPTIRPVLDTSLLDAGADHIHSMFGGTSYRLSRGINIQNGRDSLRDMINEAVETTLQARTPQTSSPINMYVYGAQGQDEEELANIVEQKLMFRINRLGAVWG